MKDFALPKRLQGIEKSVIRQVFDRALPGSLNLGLGEPDLPTPEVVRQAAVRVITTEQNGYTSHAGLPALREKIASSYSYLEGKPDRVIVTAGSYFSLYSFWVPDVLGVALSPPPLPPEHPARTTVRLSVVARSVKNLFFVDCALMLFPLKSFWLPFHYRLTRPLSL